MPLVAKGVGVGALTLNWRVVAPFSAENIALVDNFDKQTVIAIENVRRFRVLRDRLERAAATREILQANR